MKKTLACFLFVLFVSTVAFSDVKGQFKSPKVTITPKYASAFAIRNHKNQWEVEVVLSETPVNAKAAIESLDPHTQLINQDALKDQNYILIDIDQEGKVGMNATMGKTMEQFVDSTVLSLKATLTSNTLDRVAGHIVNPMTDITFDTPVTRPPSGTKLPAGGGEPGKALMALYGAMAKKDLNSITSHVSSKTLERLVADYNSPEENLQNAIETLGFWLPTTNVKVLGGDLMGDTAILEIQGDIFPGTIGYGIVRMVKTPAGWVFEDGRKLL